MFTKLKSYYYYIDLQMGKLLVSQIKIVFFLFISLAFLIGLSIENIDRHQAFILYSISFISIVISVFNLSSNIKKEQRAIKFYFSETQRILKRSIDEANVKNIKKNKEKCKVDGRDNKHYSKWLL